MVSSTEEFDRSDPFNHLISQLVLYPQPQWCPMLGSQRLIVHFPGQDASRLQTVVQRMGIIVYASVESFAKGIEGKQKIRDQSSHKQILPSNHHD